MGGEVVHLRQHLLQRRGWQHGKGCAAALDQNAKASQGGRGNDEAGKCKRKGGLEEAAEQQQPHDGYSRAGIQDGATVWVRHLPRSPQVTVERLAAHPPAAMAPI